MLYSLLIFFLPLGLLVLSLHGGSRLSFYSLNVNVSHSPIVLLRVTLYIWMSSSVVLASPSVSSVLA